MQKYAPLFLLFLLFPVSAFAASPTVYGTPALFQVNVNSTTWTDAITNTVTGQQNTALIVVLEAGNNKPDTVKANGTLMNIIHSATGANAGGAFMYYLAAPPTGTYNVVVDFTSSGGRNGNMVAFTLQDIAQTTSNPISTSTVVDVLMANVGGPADTAQSGNIITTLDNDLIIDELITTPPATAIVANGSQSVISNQVGTNNSEAVTSLPLAAHGTQSTGFTWTNAANDDLYAAALIYVAPTVVAAPSRPQTATGFIAKSTGFISKATGFIK